MNNRLRMLGFLLIAAVFPLRADTEPEHHFLLVAPDTMEEKPVERVREWMTANLHYPVRVVRPEAWEGETAAEQFANLPELERAQVIATVVLSLQLEEGRHAVLIPDERLGFVNVPLLYQEDSEQTLRRLDRQAIRIVGFSLGVPPQPMPFCALAPYNSMEELDRIGRGFSPPAMAQYRAQLLAHDIPLSEDAERLLPDVRVRMPAPPPAEVPPPAEAP